MNPDRLLVGDEVVDRQDRQETSARSAPRRRPRARRRPASPGAAARPRARPRRPPSGADRPARCSRAGRARSTPPATSTTQLTAIQRQPAKGRQKAKARIPAIHTGAVAGPSVRTSCTRNASGESGMFFSAARTAVWATNGQPFAACQIRFGAAIASAISAPAHGMPAREQAALGRHAEARAASETR